MSDVRWGMPRSAGSRTFRETFQSMYVKSGQQLLSALAALGIQDTTIATTRLFYSRRNRHPNENPIPQTRGFYLRHVFRIIIDDTLMSTPRSTIILLLNTATTNKHCTR